MWVRIKGAKHLKALFLRICLIWFLNFYFQLKKIQSVAIKKFRPENLLLISGDESEKILIITSSF